MDSVELLRRMMLIRAFERTLLARPDHGFQLLSSGEEAVAVGVAAALAPQDRVLSSGRSIGPALAQGVPSERVMAELLGKVAGPCGGKGGRGHLADPERGFFGAHAVVGGNLTIAAGVALAAQTRAPRSVVVCIFGDGACASGALHETMNIAALWKLPLVLVCNNNGWSVSTPRREALAPRRLSDLAQPFGMPGLTVDGVEVIAVRDAAAVFIERARDGGGPAFLECESERFYSHSTPTRETRGADEMARVRARCPIELHAARMIAEAALDIPAREALERQVATEVEAALRYADASPYPDASEVLGDVV